MTDHDDDFDDDGGLVPVETVGLLAQLMQANADQLHHTNQALLYSTERQMRSLAGALLRLHDSVSDLPDTVRTVALERILDSVSGSVYAARDTLAHEPLFCDRDDNEYAVVRTGAL